MVLELLVARFRTHHKLLVELRTECVVVSRVIVSMKAFASFQILGNDMIPPPFNRNSRIWFDYF